MRRQDELELNIKANPRGIIQVSAQAKAKELMPGINKCQPSKRTIAKSNW